MLSLKIHGFFCTNIIIITQYLWKQMLNDMSTENKKTQFICKYYTKILMLWIFYTQNELNK